MIKLRDFFKNLLLLYRKKVSTVLGIDLGTSTTIICKNNDGIVLNEATIVSYTVENDEKKNYLYGNKAKALIGKIPLKVNIINPLENGCICYSTIAEEMMRYFISKTVGKNTFFLPTVVASIPFCATEIEKKALQEVLERCNAKKVFFVYKTLAAAIGANLAIDKSVGTLIIDVGGGTTEISIISLNGIIKNRTFKYGGTKIDRSIANYIEYKYHLLISDDTAEKIKKQMAILYIKPGAKVKSMFIYGRNLDLNIPQEIKIDQNDIVKACAEFTNLLIENLNYVLKMTPPELMKDILNKGVTVCGGCSNIENFDFVIKEATGLSFNKPERPELCTIIGLEKIIANYKNYKHLLFELS